MKPCARCQKKPRARSQAYCRDCAAEYKRSYRKNNPAYVKRGLKGDATRRPKLCSHCGETKQRRDFYKSGTSSDGYRSQCKECYAHLRWLNDLNRQYKVTGEDYQRLFDKQGGVCAICEAGCSSGKRLCVDHCHKTGDVRGLLCGNCNRGIGLLGDDLDGVTRASYYLYTWENTRGNA